MGMFSSDKEKTAGDVSPSQSGGPTDFAEGLSADNADQLQRHLRNRQIQLIAIGGSIGTALFVSIGTGLYHGGAANLLLAFTIQSCVLAMVNNSVAEMTTAYPVSGGFIRHAGEWVDDALGFMVGWNFFFYEALLIPFEISAFCLVATFWSPTVAESGPIAGMIIGIIICYAAINILAVGAFGEAEFWLSGGKVILIFSLFFFTFVTMVGGNPQGDAYGFRNWTNGGAFREYITTGDLGRFEGFLGALTSAVFTVVGPEYISIVAAEAMRPRIYIKAAFKMVYLRFGIFFIGGALAVGIVASSRDPILQGVVENGDGSGSAASSPYVIAMVNLGISVFPDIVNALILTSIFSAGNTYTYCAVRNLYSLSLEGRAPKFLRHCTRKGVPIYCFCVVMIFPMLAFTAVSSGSSVAITWFASLVTGGGLINYIVMSITYLKFYYAAKAQGLDRSKLPYTGWFQPYCAWFALVWMSIVTCIYGYTCYLPWDVSSFFSNYTMQLFIPPLFIFWKFFKKTKWVSSAEADLVWEKPIIDAYEETFLDPPVGFWTEMGELVGIKKKHATEANRRSSVHASDVAQARRNVHEQFK
ncbi:General amino acid permease AGP2 [Fulvia fulva]|uniref:General amino acid permease AGP2 n=1 Tax=Passalora fulva TaxID=5499 RepID=A0A9Q8PAR0_PASFU|nr:General amino acid permease AGP2 [Fulvia fulva]KAK4622535.1 General amino acid permease AGP2 [Fulvia fulva]UJO19009.1 General amino acid permease AGP2 [Fulvia fulva]